jgi:RsiW-degrading membrane proteinase PrsW (M82 family)
MLLVLPLLTVIGIYVLAAVLPAVFLMRYIYYADTIEKEPPELLVSLVLKGVMAALASMLLEYAGINVLSMFLDPGSPAYILILAFLVVAVIEEGTKFFFLKRRTWNEPNFNYRFDGVVYAVFVSLGLRHLKTFSMSSVTDCPSPFHAPSLRSGPYGICRLHGRVLRAREVMCG